MAKQHAWTTFPQQGTAEHLSFLPNVPQNKEPHSATNEFWKRSTTSSSSSAFRQLRNSQYRQGRKTVALPGGRLQPLFKNHTAPPKLEGRSRGKISPISVLPGIKHGTSGGGGDAVGVNQARLQVLSGSLCNIPKPKPTTVCVYLASDVEEMKHERNYLVKHAVPELQEFCCERGLHFQLIDMNWGLGNDNPSLWATREARLREIQSCQSHSIGPHFVTLLGDRYGRVEIPHQLTSAEYELLEQLEREQVHDVGTPVLAKSYVLDHNQLHEGYTLLHDLSDDELKELEYSLEKLVCEAVNSGQMDTMNALLASTVENDIRIGILETKDPRSHCLAYRREFQDIGGHANLLPVRPHIDTLSTDGETKLHESRHKMQSALAQKVLDHLGVGNCRSYYLKWDENVTDIQEDPAFVAYLEKMCGTFIEDIKSQISSELAESAARKGGSSDIKSSVLEEIVHHSSIAKKKKVPTATLR